MPPLRFIIYPFIIVVSILLMVSILLQQRGTGLGSAFGGEGNVFASRRGVEKVLFMFSIVLTILLFSSAIISIFFVK
ncbi:MAG: preprotein translocase subunit SecG [Candidatus Terrybacteria bacterium RIFCSPLOWO2_01_FULL_44_24]|uniref:Protein-export membrane protein SecG n=1 Tax=Candidatus Terrybacteria bacterium RIFCSPHIGHO2_01_FULL_43_35 TaxID=1802361 RepID=A0A1G2PHY5_9BACT|nr:MAG: preprotein translocase subunit SecG [Candidatus Terrybacteria bacterium RIFCSPHIGHO2_01_FULL_43_35]OHA50465.1 MAG: preprotein translocase subunit SecG [Candidatus Terrybacteria bacterium RIFCSPHIGHO2_02_FULL_43_14]OHA51098.1 MAG: preprotein translocase subunit SecG [Candidatus Terrybacteria bacterium RIFCSPLOWO2_01_FULL_44_24]